MSNGPTGTKDRPTSGCANHHSTRRSGPFGMMGYAADHAARLHRHPRHRQPRMRLRPLKTLYGVSEYTSQIILNFLQCPLFFRVGRPAAAVSDLVLLVGNGTLLLVQWWTTKRTAVQVDDSILPYYACVAWCTLGISKRALGTSMAPAGEKSAQSKGKGEKERGGG